MACAEDRAIRARLNGPRAVVVLGVFAFALRLIAPLTGGMEELHFHGYHYYVEMADNLLAGEGLHRALPYGQGDRHAIRTPLYPLTLAAFRLSPAPLGLQVVIFGAACGTMTVLLAMLLARRLFGETAGLVAAALVAVWPHSVLHDGALQDTALYTALFLGFVHLAYELVFPARACTTGRKLTVALLAGACAGAAVLTRVALLPSVLAILLWAPLVASSDLRWRVARGGALAVAVLLVVLSPWLLRNARVLGAPVLTSDAGRSAWLGNNEQTFSVYPAQSIDRAEERAWAALPEATRAHVRSLGADELRSDAWFREQAIAHVREDCLGALRGGLRKAWASYSPWWNPVGSMAKQLVHLFSYGPVAILAAVACWRERRRWRELAPIPLAGLIFALQSAVFFGHSAYRVYLDPLFVVLASSLVAAWLPAALLRRLSHAKSPLAVTSSPDR